jgi:hypothetical protein
MVPKDFEELVKIAMKERPGKAKTTEEVWNKFLSIVFMGSSRSEPEVNFIINMLKQKKLLDFDYVSSTDGDDWRDAVNEILNERIPKIKDEEITDMLKALQKEIFRISASIKGGARFFKKSEITPKKLDELLDTKEKTWQFIDDLAKNEDVSNVKYTKIIIWLHAIGYADDFCPPSWQTKQFVNEVYGYYQFYEDDKYFMKKTEELSDEIKKKVKGSTARDVSSAIFYYATLRGMMPPRSPQKKKFNPGMLIKFLESKKLTLKKLSEHLGDMDKRLELIDEINGFMVKKMK